MSHRLDDDWISQLYAETAQLWERQKDPRGYAIFYSPVSVHPKIMIIGYNPGGDERSFLADNHSKPPDEHEYLKKEYRLAKQMDRIFQYAGLANELGRTVKFNLNFFRSEKAADLAGERELQNFSEQKALRIIERLGPGMIITEGLATFDRLMILCSGTVGNTVTFNERTIARIGTIAKIRAVGLLHPSGGRGISNAILEKMGETIRSCYAEIPAGTSSL